MRAPLAVAVAIATGLVILAAYFIPLPMLTELQSTLLGWAVIVGAFAGLVAIFNLVLSHWRKATSSLQRDLFSYILLAAFFITLVAGLWFGPSHPQVQRGVQAVIVPVEASLMAALAVALAYACFRLLRLRRDPISLLFALSALVFLILLGGFLAGASSLPVLGDLIAFIDRLPIAGARGILLGVALGGLTAGLRILMGADRPYSG
jgi:hypothetical protein